MLVRGNSPELYHTGYNDVSNTSTMMKLKATTTLNLSDNCIRELVLTHSPHSSHTRGMGGLLSLIHRHAQGLSLRFRETSLERHPGTATMLHECKSSEHGLSTIDLHHISPDTASRSLHVSTNAQDPSQGSQVSASSITNTGKFFHTKMPMD